MAPDYEVDQDELLFFCPRSATKSEDRVEMVRLVIPELLQQDFLHHYHTSLEGGHQCIGRTYQQIRAKFHWRGHIEVCNGMCGECVDCETGTGRPGDRSGSPETYKQRTLFRFWRWIIFRLCRCRSKGTQELLIWVDRFSGYVGANASASRTAQTIAENYK